MKKRMIVLGVITMLFIALFAVSASADSHPDTLVGNAFGSGCSWGITDDNVLYIWPTDGVSGTLPSNSSNNWPWKDSASAVVRAVIEPGVIGGELCAYLFDGFQNATSIDVSGLDTSNVTNMRCMFYECSGLTSLDISGFDTSNVKNMRHMLFGCSGLTSLDLSHFNTSNATDMYYMFCNCSGLTFLDVSGFDTSNVTNMGYMFYGCESLTSLDVSGWNTSSVTDMGYMFCECTNLISLDVSGWDTSNVTVMTNMFARCPNLVVLDVSNWNTSKVTSMCGARGSTLLGMFNGCSSLTSLDVSHFDTSKVGKLEYMFYNCSNLTVLDVSNWDTSRVTDMSGLFSGCSGLTSLDVSNFDMSKVVDACYMFSGCKGLTFLDVSDWDTSSLRDTYYMFNGCNNLASLDVSNWDTSVMARAEAMFYGCWSLTSLDVANWTTSNVTDMSSMFANCRGLTSLDVSNWDTSKVTDMASVFGGCTGLTSLDVADWNTSNAYYTSGMFSGCESLTELNVANWDLSHAVYMYQMFSNCTGLTSLNVANWNTSRAESMWGMFYNCSSLTSLNLSGWDVSHVETMSNSQGYGMFRNCSNLVSLDISGWDTSSLRTKAYMFDGCDKLSEITLGNKYRTAYTSHMVTLPTPPSSMDGVEYTRKWIREDRVYGPFAPSEFASNYNNETMAGTWVWEPKATDYTLRFSSASYPGAVGEMAQVTTSAKSDYQLAANKYMLFGFVFDHWDDGNGRTYQDCDVIPANTYQVNDVVTLTAVFKRRNTNVTMQDGSFEFVIRADETAIFDPVPANTTYQVYEQTPKGWNLIYQQGNSGVIASLIQSEAIFLNQYDPLKVTIRLAGTKLLDEAPAEMGSFMFLLCEDDELIEMRLVGEGGLIEFDPITYDQPGVHHYYIREVVGSETNIDYDGHVEVVTVIVTADDEGGLIAAIDMDEDEILFQNVSKPGKLVLQKKGVTDYDVSLDGMFYYEVQFLTASGQPYELFGSTITYEEREDVIDNYPDLQPVEQLPYTLTVRYIRENLDGSVKSEEVNTHEYYAGALVTIEELYDTKYQFRVAEGYGVMRLNTAWCTVMPRSDAEVILRYAPVSEVTISRSLWRSKVNSTASTSLPLRSAITFTRNVSYGNVEELPSTAMKIDDGTTMCSVYFWKDGNDCYWWSDANVIYLPTNCSEMFRSCTNLIVVDMSGWDVSRVVTMEDMFFGCSRVTSLDVSNWDVSSVTNMEYMFNGCRGLSSLDLSGWSVGNVERISYMFRYCSGLQFLDVSNWDTSKVTTLSEVFGYCTNLMTLNVSGWDTSNVIYMNGIFRNCENLVSLDVSDWNTHSVTSMRMMFYECKGLTSLDVSGWDTSNITEMEYMFRSCLSLPVLDLSGWNTSNMTDMPELFVSCRVLTTIYVGDQWDVSNVTYSYAMFSGCVCLVGGNGTPYNQSYIDGTYARVDNPPDEPGYLTYKAH